MSTPNHELRVRLRSVTEPVVERLGYELAAVEVYGGTSRKILVRLTIDRMGGVGIADCARVSRAVSPVLDVEDVVVSAYELEVSSPGTEPPLQREKEWKRFFGCLARARLFGMESRRWIRGRIGPCADGMAVIETSEGPRSFAIADVDRANVELNAEQFARMGQGLPPVSEGETP